MTDFTNYGTPSFTTTEVVANSTLLFAPVPALGGNKTVALDTETASPVEKHSLVGMDGQLLVYDAEGEVPENEVVNGEDVEATRDALLAALADNEDLDSFDGTGGTDIVNFTFAASPIVLSETGDSINVLIGTSATFGSNPTALDTITVGAVTYTFVAGAPGANEIQIGVDADATVTNAAAAIDGNPATSLVDGTGAVLSINFVGPSAILTTTSGAITLALGGGLQFSGQPEDGDTLTVGDVTYTFATEATVGSESIPRAAGVAMAPITQSMIDNAEGESGALFVLVATSGNFLLEGLVLDESITALSKSEQLRVVSAAMAQNGDNMLVNSNRYAGT